MHLRNGLLGLVVGVWSVSLLLIGVGRCYGAEEGATVYKIVSRWQPKEFLYAADGRVGYGAGDDDAYRWTLTEVNGCQRIKNVSTGQCIVINPKTADVSLAAPADGEDAHADWIIGTVAADWVSIKNRATEKFLNCEHQLGRVEGDIAKEPSNKTLWSAQWKLIHVAGPVPTPLSVYQKVVVRAPAYGATVKGNSKVDFRAPGLSDVVVHCWQRGGAFGHDSTVAPITFNTEGQGSFIFPADDYPHGPIMVRITGSAGKKTDTCWLQLYNAGGVPWNEGIPAAVPQPAKGMKLLFADDFTGPLSISATGKGTTYCSHKPGGGDFGSIPFADHVPGKSPFSQVDTYLRIRADVNAKTTGLISALRMDGTGITAKVPCYFECRMTAQTAPGTWPAFWLMTRSVYKGLKAPADELDTIEGYGGEGPHNPNQTGYWTTTHYWNQGEEGKKQPRVYKQIPMTKIGGGASWPTTFHVYANLITETDTVYYCDGVEVARHPTGKLSKTEPWFFLINLAIGGNGWPVDLSRYGGVADMYVDYVRVYQGDPSK